MIVSCELSYIVASCQKMTNKKWKGSQTDPCPENKCHPQGKEKLLFNNIFLIQALLCLSTRFFETMKKSVLLEGLPIN